MNAATNMGIIKNKRGSVKKDDQLQTITLIPGAPNKKLQNVPNFQNQMNSIDYTGTNEDSKTIVSGSRRVSNRSGANRVTSNRNRTII